MRFLVIPAKGRTKLVLMMRQTTLAAVTRKTISVVVTRKTRKTTLVDIPRNSTQVMWLVPRMWTWKKPVEVMWFEQLLS